MKRGKKKLETKIKDNAQIKHMRQRSTESAI